MDYVELTMFNCLEDVDEYLYTEELNYSVWDEPPPAKAQCFLYTKDKVFFVYDNHQIPVPEGWLKVTQQLLDEALDRMYFPPIYGEEDIYIVIN